MFGSTRKQRGKTQNIYLVESRYNDSVEKREYVVLGSTGNVYTVEISICPTCTCPDYETRGRRCKHIYFILSRLMKVSPANEDKEFYTFEDLAVMFCNIPDVTQNIMIDGGKKNKYEKLKINDKTGEVEKKGLDDLCPICLDDLDDGSNEEIEYCRYSCGKPIHKVCFEMWCKKKGSKNCVFCSSPWISLSSSQKNNSKYLNLN